MAAVSKELISVREFSRRMGVSDTAIRNEIYDKKTRPNGCLRAGVEIKQAGSKKNPIINFPVGYAEWLKAGRTIKNPDYYPKLSGDATAKIDTLKKDITESLPGNSNPLPGKDIGGLGYKSLIYEGMNPFAAQEVKEMYEAGLKELAYFKQLGKLAPVDRVNFVLFEYGKTIKASLLQIPSRIASRVRAASSDREAQDIIYKEFETLLLALSKGPTQSMDENAKDEFDEDVDKFSEYERSVAEES